VVVGFDRHAELARLFAIMKAGIVLTIEDERISCQRRQLAANECFFKDQFAIRSRLRTPEAIVLKSMRKACFG
jgi:hypothetical protein